MFGFRYSIYWVILGFLSCRCWVGFWAIAEYRAFASLYLWSTKGCHFVHYRSKYYPHLNFALA